MSVERASEYREAFGALRQFIGRKKPLERCELCGALLEDTHPHILELAARKLLCACEACAILFSTRGDARYKRVSRRVVFL
jgi:hypothetical protein